MAAKLRRPTAGNASTDVTAVLGSPQGRFSLEGLRAAGPEAASLVAAMLAQASGARPPMAAVLAHPAWWPPAQKLAFLVDLSNAMEFQDRAVRVADFDLWVSSISSITSTAPHSCEPVRRDGVPGPRGGSGRVQGLGPPAPPFSVCSTGLKQPTC